MMLTGRNSTYNDVLSDITSSLDSVVRFYSHTVTCSPRVRTGRRSEYAPGPLAFASVCLFVCDLSVAPRISSMDEHPSWLCNLHPIIVLRLVLGCCQSFCIWFDIPFSRKSQPRTHIHLIPQAQPFRIIVRFDFEVS
jgi:hypothetical protein